jgi:epoxyqueuosine reductase
MERDFARAAGLGWIGKNTLLLNQQQGSWMFLAALLTDLELEYDEPAEADHCGTCRMCLDACPTHAFPAPYILDATRCVSYLTIELHGPVPESLRPGIGDWLFGCDVCQEVCPWNRKSPAGEEAAFGPLAELNPAAIGELFQLDEAAFRRRFRATALWRARRSGLLRNAAIVLGNRRDASSTGALGLGLGDNDPIVRGACAWALGQLATDSARHLLACRLAQESNCTVRWEIQQSLDRASTQTTNDRGASGDK